MTKDGGRNKAYLPSFFITPMKTHVIGLGNPILGDDSVGWRVAEEVAKVTAKLTNVGAPAFIAYPPCEIHVGYHCLWWRV